VGVDFKFTDDMLTYASVSDGLSSAGLQPRPFTPEQAVAVGGEEATAYELGLKSELFDRRLRLNLAAFYTDYNERIVPIGGTDCQWHRG
jgi:iron complex outermembrane receptor protein